MRLISKELLIRHIEKRGPVAGFISYVSNDKPILMHCFGWEDYSDAYDDYAVQFSYDNGKTWSKPEIRWQSTIIPEGKIRYGEPAVLWDPDREHLIVLTDKVFYPKDQLDVDTVYSLVMDIYDGRKQRWLDRKELSFPGQYCPAMSFSFPIKTSRGRLLFPAMRQVRDSTGKAIHYPGCWAPVDEMVTVIGEYEPNGQILWHLGKPCRIDMEISSRGVDENTLIELTDGRIAALLRGDNSMFPHKPGYKWLSFSSDQGETWTSPVPMGATNGQTPESPACGSALFRSLTNGKIYWIGNLCLRGERPNGNLPRTTVYVMEVQEQPFAFKTETAFAIDEKGFNDSPDIQFSNFRFYQDRITGELVVYMVRFCEKGIHQIWKSDYYRYRIDLSD